MTGLKTLQELRRDIRKEKKHVGGLPFSHNIISMCLKMIVGQFGEAEADKAIDDLGLEKYGWRKVN